jgi:hypothetical protein
LGIVIWLAIIVVQAAGAIALSRYFGIVVGGLLYALAMISCVGLAGLLLLNVTVESVTWKNRVAGVCLPWSTFVGGGQLSHLLVKNAVAALAFGALVVLCDRLKLFHRGSGANAVGETHMHWSEVVILWVTVAGWIVMAIGWLWMLRSIVANHSDIISVLLNRQGTWMPLLLPPVIVAASIALRVAGRSWIALTVVGAPLLMLFTPVLLMLAVIVMHYVMGKPMRWN